MAITIQAILGRDLQTIHFTALTNGSPAIPQRITAVVSNPTVEVNGSPATFTGPSWTDTSLNSADVQYLLSTKAQTTDALTFSASAGWLTAKNFSGVASSALAATNAAITNSQGQLEVLGGAWSNTIPVVQQTTMTPTMPAGQGQNYPNANPFGVYSPALNLLVRSGPTWNGALTYTSSGAPATVNPGGSCNASIWLVQSASNGVDGKFQPQTYGTYTFEADESNPGSNAITVSLTSDNGEATISSPTITGTGVGKTWTWTVELVSGYNNWQGDLRLHLACASGQSAITLTNMSMTPPLRNGTAQAPQRSNPSAIDGNLIAGLTSSTGYHPSCLRCGYTAGYSTWNTVDYSDQQHASNFSWVGQNPSFTITSIRGYLLSNSPNVYMSDSYSGLPSPAVTASATPGGSPLPYYFSPSSAAWWGDAGGYAIIEAVTSVPHGLKSGWCLANFGNYTLSVTWVPLDGTSGSVTLPLTSPLNPVVWVTGADTFIYWTFIGSSSLGKTATPSGSYSTSISVNYFVPDTGTTPMSVAAQEAQTLGVDLWAFLSPVSTVACAYSQGQEVGAIYQRAGNLYLEMGDEPWNLTSQGRYYQTSMGVLTQLDTLASPTNYDFYIARGHQLMTSFAAGFAAAGGVATIRRVCGAQFGDTGLTETIVSICNKYQIPYDDFGYADYYQGEATDSVANQVNTTIQTAYSTWPVASIVDSWRWFYIYNTSYWNPSSGLLFAHVNGISGWNVTGYSAPKAVQYEMGTYILPSQVASGALAHDCRNHPYVYDFVRTMLLAHQIVGDSFATWSSYCQFPASNDMYWMYMWCGQNAGYGNGTSGGVVNQYATSQGGSPADGKSHEGPDAVNTYGNDSVIGQALKDWWSNASPSPTYAVSGATTCVVGVASGNITVTPSATISSDTVSIASSVGGDTLTPASLMFVSSSSPQSLTLTASSAGVRTLTFTSADSDEITGSPWTVTASLATTTTTAANAAAVFSLSNQSVSLSATVTSSSGTVNESTVTFTLLNGIVIIGSPITVNVIAGSASGSYTLPGNTQTGTYTIEAVFAGDANFATSSDESHHLAVTAASTTTVASNASAPFSPSSQVVPLTATVTSGAGTVNEATLTFTILNGASPVGSPITVNVSAGAANGNYTLPGATASGTYTIEATYNGDANLATSSDESHALTVTAGPITAGPQNVTGRVNFMPAFFQSGFASTSPDYYTSQFRLPLATLLDYQNSKPGTPLYSDQLYATIIEFTASVPVTLHFASGSLAGPFGNVIGMARIREFIVLNISPLPGWDLSVASAATGGVTWLPAIGNSPPCAWANGGCVRSSDPYSSGVGVGQVVGGGSDGIVLTPAAYAVVAVVLVLGATVA